MTRHIIFDTETTGLSHKDGDRLIEIGAVEMAHGGLTGRTFHELIDPERGIPIEAQRIHQISDAMVAGKPKFADPRIGPAFLAFIEGATLVAHNASFDVGFLGAELRRAGLDMPRCEVIDTVQIARRKFPGSPASLDALCKRFEIDTTQREKDGHGALLDSRLLAEVWIELTGGRQGGFALDRNGADQTGAARSAGKTPQRGKPRPDLLTEAEKTAHTAFVAEMTAPVWSA